MIESNQSVTADCPEKEYCDALSMIVALAERGEIDARMFNILWDAIEEKHAGFLVYQRGIKNSLPLSPKSAS